MTVELFSSSVIALETILKYLVQYPKEYLPMRIYTGNESLALSIILVVPSG